MKIVKIEWSSIEQHSGWFKVPDDFDQNDWDMANALADHDEDTSQGLERENIEVYSQHGPPPGQKVPRLALEGHEAF